jgi:hypothetical protein
MSVHNILLRILNVALSVRHQPKTETMTDVIIKNTHKQIKVITRSDLPHF